MEFQQILACVLFAVAAIFSSIGGYVVGKCIGASEFMEDNE